MRSFFHFFAVLALIAYGSAEVRVWEGKLSLPTYEEGLPDPNPPFDQLASNRFNYPYTLRDNLTSRHVEHDWRAIYLENEYLKCSVLPDIGGHLYTCLDKLSGQSMFYANPSIKKAAVGYRGAWAAFGIEFNFPVSHNWASMSPVDFAFRNNDDGSGSVIVGNVDRVYGMEWTVELILRPKSTVLEERVTLSNRSDVRHRFYWWNNAAVKISDDSRIVYPMRFAASHGFTEVRRWPVGEDGKDLSVIRNQTDGAVSFFSHGTREDFMGVWHPANRTGTVHFAKYEELPAKKIWSWGVDAEGLDWRKALSDDNSGYIEIQGGLFRNQETYAFLEPRQEIHFSEFWMPVRELDGISRANLAGVLSLFRRGSTLIVGFNPNQPIDRALVSISSGDKKLFGETVQLTPEHTWVHEIAISDVTAKYTVEIRDGRGSLLIRQTEGEYDWDPESEVKVGPQPTHRVAEPDMRSCDEWIQLGNEYELNGRLLQALDVYTEALRRFPDTFEAAKSAGRLAASLLRFEEAKKLLEYAQSRNTSDAEISYYLGIAQDGLGSVRKAKSAYEEAERSPSFRAAAALRLGEMLAREGDQAEAQRHFEMALIAAPDDPRAFEESVAIRRAGNKTQDGNNVERKGFARFPLSHFLREELGNPDLQQLGNDSTRVLNLAAQYMRLGLYQNALKVVSREYPQAQADESEPGQLPPGRHPMVAYFRGYCRERIGQSGLADYKIASQLLTSYVFPSSAEELSVLQAALRANPEDASAHYLLGTLLFSRGVTEAAIAEWTKAQELNPGIPVLAASMGLALLHEKNEPEQAASAFLVGLRNDAANITIYMGADQALSLLARPARERTEVLEKYPHLADAPSALMFELILNLAEAGNFQRAETLFRDHFFAREEGGTNVRQVWVEVELQKLLSWTKESHCTDVLALANRLGAPVPGLAFTNDGLQPIVQSARTNYLVGTAYARCGSTQEAMVKFQSASSATDTDQIFWAWLAAKRLRGFDENQWHPKLQTALQQAKTRSENSSYPGWWDYTAGTLANALGDDREAEIRFRKALLLPDRMLSYHLTRFFRLSGGDFEMKREARLQN